jgi:DNA-binding NarL/FixJ family response regulator
VTTRPPRVFLISPSPAVRAGLRALLGAEDIAVVGEAVRLEPESPPPDSAAADVLLIDAGGLEAADLAGLEGGGAPPAVVLLGPLVGEDRLPAQLAGRAWAYLPRDASGQQLAAAVRAANSGLVAVDVTSAPAVFARTSGSIATAAIEELTVREREVLQLVAEGLPNKTIARRLGISDHTVKFHVAALLTKLGAGSRTEAVHLGARRGLITL